MAAQMLRATWSARAQKRFFMMAIAHSMVLVCASCVSDIMQTMDSTACASCSACLGNSYQRQTARCRRAAKNANDTAPAAQLQPFFCTREMLKLEHCESETKIEKSARVSFF